METKYPEEKKRGGEDQLISWSSLLFFFLSIALIRGE